MRRLLLLLIPTFLYSLTLSAAETLRWTGKGDGVSFWSTNNWAIGTGSTQPTSAQWSTTAPIEFNLLIENSAQTIGESGITTNAIIGSQATTIQISNSALAFDVYTKKGFRAFSPLTIHLNDSYLGVDQLQNMTINVSGSSTLSIYESSLFSAINNSTINLIDDNSWVGFRNIRPTMMNNASLAFIKVKGSALTIGENVELLPYYAGTLIKVKTATPTPPLTIYPQEGLIGTQGSVEAQTILTANTIPLGDNHCNSFLLRKGYMLTLAQNSDGTGMGKVYIAAEKDLTVTSLPEGLKGDVSFIRVLPWIYTNKRGVGGNEPKLSAVKPSWYYNWGSSANSAEGLEYVPMAWGKNAASTSSVANYIAKTGVTHLLAFNEPDGKEQSNITPEVAVDAYKNLLASGLRIGAPSPKEEGINNWIPTFMEGCKTKNLRVDFICVHWYDWGNWNSTNNTTPNVDQAVTRFKNYLQNVYNKYKLPIWITEFNINLNRPTSVQDQFLEKMIPVLESLPFIERYAYFNPNAPQGATIGNGEFVIGGEITSTGTLYRDMDHSGAIASPVKESSGSFFDQYTPITTANLLKNGDFEGVYTNNIPESWTGGAWNNGRGNTNPMPQSGTAYHRFTNVNAGQWAGLNQVCALQPNTLYKLTFYTYYAGTATEVSFNVGIKGYATQTAADAGTGNDGAPDLTQGTPFVLKKAAGAALDTEWNKQEILFTTTEETPFVKLFFSKSGAQWYLDNAQLTEVGSASGIQPIEKNRKFNYFIAHKTLSFTSEENGNIAIYDLRGAQTLSTPISQGNNLISLHGVEKGVYLLTFINDQGEKNCVKIVL